MKRPALKWTAGDMLVLLKAHFEAPKFAVLSGVCNGTGNGVTRTADALVMGTWPSIGLHLHGIEIKVARSDWLKEMQDPSKAETFARYCHYWWIVAAPAIVRLEELPATWGLLEPAGKGLKIRRPATLREKRLPVDDDLLAAIFRRVTEQQPAREVLQAAMRKAAKEARAEALLHRGTDRERDNYELTHLKQRVKEFEEASGIVLATYHAGTVGKALKQLLDHQEAVQHAQQRTKWTLKGLRECVAYLERVSTGRVRLEDPE